MWNIRPWHLLIMYTNTEIMGFSSAVPHSLALWKTEEEVAMWDRIASTFAGSRSSLRHSLQQKPPEAPFPEVTEFSALLLGLGKCYRICWKANLECLFLPFSWFFEEINFLCLNLLQDGYNGFSFPKLDFTRYVNYFMSTVSQHFYLVYFSFLDLPYRCSFDRLF